MLDTRMRSVLVAIVLLALGAGGASVFHSRRAAPAPIVVTGPTAAPPATALSAPTVADTPPEAAPPPAAPAPKSPVPELLYVHVAGAVRQPSLYQLPPGSRVMHAIKAAGGPTSKADMDAINLAEKIHDGEKIYVPAKQAAAPAPRPVAVIPVPVAPAPVSTRTASAHAGSGKPAAAAKPGKLISPTQGQIAINTASEAQLEELPGIGPAMAGRILAYRQQAGGFQKVDDLMNVGGIGPKKFARIAPLVKLN